MNLPAVDVHTEAKVGAGPNPAAPLRVVATVTVDAPDVERALVGLAQGLGDLNVAVTARLLDVHLHAVETVHRGPPLGR